jgi:hypothetical protein
MAPVDKMLTLLEHLMGDAGGSGVEVSDSPLLAHFKATRARVSLVCNPRLRVFVTVSLLVAPRALADAGEYTFREAKI